MIIVTEELQDEHRIILRNLDVLDEMASGVGVALDLGIALKEVDLIARYVDGCHHGKEEVALFPAIRRVMDDSESGVDRALGEHQEARRLLSEMRSAIGVEDRSRFSDAAARLSSLLRSHVDFEESMVFANAEALLSEEEKAAVSKAYALLADSCKGFGELDSIGIG